MVALVVIGLTGALTAWLLFLNHKRKASSTLAGRTDARKRLIRDELIEKWRQARHLGSTETASEWLKRKLPSLDVEWLEKNSNSHSDEALIGLALNHLFSKPYFIEWLLERDREAQQNVE
jgi:hypothetical protein